jgi:hypothetical protein
MKKDPLPVGIWDSLLDSAFPNGVPVNQVCSHPRGQTARVSRKCRFHLSLVVPEVVVLEAYY